MTANPLASATPEQLARLDDLARMTRADLIELRLKDLARLVGTLRRRFASNPDAWSGAYLVEQLADGIEWLDALLGPSAGELQSEFFCICGDHDLAVEEALDATDRRVAQLRWLLGRSAA